jgi:HEPN domain-containing protein
MSAGETNYQAWLVKAENDLLNIRNNLQASRVPWDTVCFHAQQAAEKLLKGFLVHHAQAPPRSHDLVALLARCVELERRLEILETDCLTLKVEVATNSSRLVRFLRDDTSAGHSQGKPLRPLVAISSPSETPA